MRSLELLNLNANRSLTTSAFAPLSQLRKLRRLEVADTPFGDAGLKAIRELPDLRVLNLYFTEITGRGIAEIGLPPLLERLDLTRFPGATSSLPIGDSTMPAIVKLNHLRELILAYCPRRMLAACILTICESSRACPCTIPRS